MPIQINPADLAAASVPAPKYLPSFFDPSEFTGNGGKGGLFHSAFRVSTPSFTQIPLLDSSDLRFSESNGNVKTLFYPISILSDVCYSDKADFILHDFHNFKAIGSDPSGTETLFMDLSIVNLSIRKTKDFLTNTTNREVSVCWRMTLGWSKSSQPLCFKAGEWQTFTMSNPASFLKNLNELMGIKIVCDPNALNPLMAQPVAAVLCRQSQIFQEQCIDVIDWALEHLSTCSERVQAVESIARRIDGYRIPLAVYRQIYDRLSVDVQILEAAGRSNLQILMFKTLFDLDTARKQDLLIAPPLGTDLVPTDPFYSMEQAACIREMDSLILVQAVAGSGKSSLILGRIQHLIQCGVAPEDILALSFTNAAADHLHEKCPMIKSMTIDSMIAEIYALNFPGHQNAPNSTLRHKLLTFQDPKADRLARLLELVESNTSGSYTELNRFVEDNLCDVLDLLNRCAMVSLELKTILCYQTIHQLSIPESVRCCFLIVDEVQDNSIFQFIYLLKHALNQNLSLMLVGDSAQTLYEWRFSDPKALNALEASNVFKTHKLTVNFRSCQEILDFANCVLENIEANQFARLSLVSNNLLPVTQDSFSDHVSFQTIQSTSIQKEYLEQTLPDAFENNMVPWIDQQIKSNRQVCILAATHAELRVLETLIPRFFAGTACLNIASSHRRPITLFSYFVRYFWDEVSFTFSISHDFARSLGSLIASHARFDASGLIRQWYNECGSICNTLQRSFTIGQLTQNELSDALKNCLFDFEARLNIHKMGVLSRVNQKRKECTGTTPILLSTVHSAKGLEFDAVCVLIREGLSVSESEKRMRYVALTRAKDYELVQYFIRKEGFMQENYRHLAVERFAAALDPVS